VSDRIDELGDATVALITFTRVRNLRGYRSRLGLPFPVLADEDRAVYRAYGLGRGPWWRVYGWRTLTRYAQLLRGGRRLERPTEDTLQLGGDFVVDRDGALVFAHRSKGPDDRPEVDDLIRAVGNLRQ
jgi:hypothetical protein